MSDLQALSSSAAVPVPVDSAAASAICAMIQLSDTAQIATFGEQAQREVAGFADKVLQQTKGRDLGDTANLLSDLMAKAKGLDPANLDRANPLTRLVGGVRRQIGRFRGQFETVSSQIDAISAQLQVRLERMREDMKTLDGLHAQSLVSISHLDAFIAAGKGFAENYRARELPVLEAAAAEQALDPSQALLNAQAHQDALQALDHLEKRVYTLQQARQIAIQQLPQIRIVQNGDATLVESLGASINLTIPAWKQKMVLMLGLERQREALAMQKAVADTTNEMIRRTSEMLKVQSLQIEQESQRGIVDLAALAKANTELVETIAGVIDLQAHGRDARRAAEVEMQRQITELTVALSGKSALAA